MPSYLTSIVLHWSPDSLTESRITNPTFDTDITGWTETDSGGASLTPTHDTTTVRTGAGSLKLVQTAAGDDDHMSCTFSGVAGVTYQIKAWINVTAFTFGSTGLRAFGPGGTPNSFTVISAVTDGWVQQAVELTPTTSGNVTVRLYSPQGTCYWDDVSVVGWATVANSEIQSIEWWAGIDREGNDPEPGGMQVTLKNKNRKWEPLFGSNLIDTQQRFRLTLNGTQEGVWYTESFDLDYPDGQRYSWVTIGCGDGFSILALDDLPSLNPPEAETYEDVINFYEPWGYWRLGEPEGTRAQAIIRRRFRGKGKHRRKIKVRRGTRYSTREEAGGASGPAGTYVNTPMLGQPGGILGDAGTSVHFEGGTEYVTIPIATDDFRNLKGLTVMAWANMDAATGVTYFVSGPNDSLGVRIFDLFVQSSGSVLTSGFRMRNDDGTHHTALGGDPTVGVWSMVAGTWDGGQVRIYLDGVETDSESQSHIRDGVSGAVQIWAQSSNEWGYAQEVAILEHALTAEQVMDIYTAGAARGYGQQTSGERVSALAESTLWADTSIQTSGRDVLPVMHFGQPKLDELAEAAHAEGPQTLFFFNGAGDPVFLGFEWQDTNANYNTVQWTFTDDGTGEPYQYLQIEYDFETFNEVLASHESGESVTVTDTTESGKRGRRVNSEYTDVLLMNHHDVEGLAAGVLDYYKEPAKRPVSLTIDGHHSLAQILDLDIGHLIHIKKRGETGAATERVCHIIAKRKSIDTSKHLLCTYMLSRGLDPTDGFWHLGYDAYSSLGETTVLA